MRLTIFTPTYNRADKLDRLYQSLLRQSCHAFEWLIIDDGSSDDTEGAVTAFQSSAQAFPIRYIKQENGGKHRAYNKALELAKGAYFFCVDSDDWLANNAVEHLLKACEGLNEKLFIAAYKQDEQGKRLSTEFPKIQECTLCELSAKYQCSGEYSLIFPTDLARKFPFPVFDGEKFITESVIYDRLSAVADVRLLPQVITICEYQEDGLSNNLNLVMKKNPAGYCLYFMQRIDIATSLRDRIITVGKYHCFCMFAREQRSKYIGNHRWLVRLTRPLGVLFRIYYVRKRGF